MEEFGVPLEFITGEDPNLQCESVLGGGGYAKVYCVCSIPPFTDPTYADSFNCS